MKMTAPAALAIACFTAGALGHAQTAAADQFSVVGTLVGGGVECPLLRADSGRLYSLAGDTGEYGRGDRVRVEGRLAEVSICQQGATIEVRRIEEAE